MATGRLAVDASDHIDRLTAENAEGRKEFPSAFSAFSAVKFITY